MHWVTPLIFAKGLWLPFEFKIDCDGHGEDEGGHAGVGRRGSGGVVLSRDNKQSMVKSEYGQFDEGDME